LKAEKSEKTMAGARDKALVSPRVALWVVAKAGPWVVAWAVWKESPLDGPKVAKRAVSKAVR